jgi:hypothetical protein
MLAGSTFVMGGAGLPHERGDDLYVSARSFTELSALNDFIAAIRNAVPFLIDDVRALRWGDPRVSVSDATTEALLFLSDSVAAAPWEAIESSDPGHETANWIEVGDAAAPRWRIMLTTYGGSAPFPTSQFIAAARNALPALVDEFNVRKGQPVDPDRFKPLSD